MRTFRTTFSKEMRMLAKRHGYGLFVIGYITPTGARVEYMGPANEKELATISRCISRLSKPKKKQRKK